MPQLKTFAETELELTEFVGKYYADPLGWARVGFPWGKAGLLAKLDGPCPCQVKILGRLGELVRERRFNGRDAVKPIRIAVSSGHGIGKSILFGIIDNWIKSTRPHSQGTVTANTYTQLETKTWASIQAMAKLSLTAHWFDIGASRISRKESKETWFSSPQSCSEENSEAFAGQHAAGSTSYYLNDECSAIADIIFEVQEGGLTDGEAMQFLFGNMTRSQGKFYRVMSGMERGYEQITIDSRNCPLTNKEQIAEWIADYGEDSDFVRVRVRGLPPAAADAQFIPGDLVKEAVSRFPRVIGDEPLVCGVDLSWGGADFNTIRFRRGNDAQSIVPIRIPGELTRDPMVMVLKLAEVLGNEYAGRRVSQLFMDSAGIAGPVAQRLREMGHANVLEINFGAHSPDPKYKLMRSYMWGSMKEWLQKGGAIDKDRNLNEDLTAPGYTLTRNTEVLLEPKDQIRKRIGHSTDDGDALALTFAAPVRVLAKAQPTESVSQGTPSQRNTEGSWMT